MIDDIIKNITTHYDYVAIGAFLGFLVTLYTFYKQVGVPVYKATIQPVVTLFSSVVNSPSRLDKMEGKLDTIIAELRPNGGSSIKDQINRLESSNIVSWSQKQLLLDIHPNGIFTTDKDGNCTFANRTYLDMIGGTMEDFRGNNWIKIVAPEDRNKVQEEWYDSVKENRDFDLEYSLIHLQNGSRIKVRGKGVPIRHPNGNVLGYNGIITFLPNDRMATQ